MNGIDFLKLNNIRNTLYLNGSREFLEKIKIDPSKIKLDPIFEKIKIREIVISTLIPKRRGERYRVECNDLIKLLSEKKYGRISRTTAIKCTHFLCASGNVVFVSDSFSKDKSKEELLYLYEDGEKNSKYYSPHSKAVVWNMPITDPDTLIVAEDLNPNRLKE